MFLLIPTIAFSFGYTHSVNFAGQDILFPQPNNDHHGDLKNANGINSNDNLNIQLPKPEKNVNGTITVQKVDDNETKID